MEIIGVHLPEGGALDEPVRALFELQSQALKAAQEQADAFQLRIDALEQQQADKGHRGNHDAGDAGGHALPEAPSHDPARTAIVAAIAQLEAKTNKEVEQDEPAVTYDRVRNVVIALLVIDVSLLAIAPYTGGDHGKAQQVVRLFSPLALTGLCVLFFGTLDSSAMAATAARTWRAYFIVMGALYAAVYAVEGKSAAAAFQLILLWFGGAYYCAWLLSTVRERMRTRFKGKLAERAQLYTARLFQIASVQMALFVQGLAQGIGPLSTGRNEAIFAFSASLSGAWVFSTGVFDAGEADTALRATRLRLSFRESAALAASMLYVLTGLAGYVMAEQGDPDPATTALLVVGSFVCVLVAAVLVGRLVKDANNKEQPQHADAAGGVQMVANPARVQTPAPQPAGGADMA